MYYVLLAMAMSRTGMLSWRSVNVEILLESVRYRVEIAKEANITHATVDDARQSPPQFPNLQGYLGPPIPVSAFQIKKAGRLS